jgi:protein-S-isoprenylcysteine O-methyltransferase Ste14
MKPIIPPPLIGLALIGAMYLGARHIGVAPFDFPGRAAFAALLAAAGLFIDAVSVAAFIRARTTINPLAPAKAEKLVASGLFKMSRNPMYLGMLLMLVGAFVYFGEGLNALLLGLFVVLINEFQIKPEERALEEKFGDDYRAYKKRVRRWL